MLLFFMNLVEKWKNCKIAILTRHLSKIGMAATSNAREKSVKTSNFKSCHLILVEATLRPLELQFRRDVCSEMQVFKMKEKLQIIKSFEKKFNFTVIFEVASWRP